MKIKSISINDTDYPQRLRDIPSPPESIYVRGMLPPDSQISVAIIGTRKPTRYGEEVTLQLAQKLAERGVAIISGLALGVDALGHKGALKARGTTIAVLAGGVDDPSPYTNRQIADAMLDHNGALISEFPPGTPPFRTQFLARNRIVSGLCDALIVTEASMRSGTSNTVAHALQQGRDIYAVPGPITSPMSSGCNQLIAQGATPIVSIDDFVDLIAPREEAQAALFAYDANEQVIIDLMYSGVRDGEELQQKSQLDAGLFAQTMTMLEIRGAIKPLGANHWSL